MDVNLVKSVINGVNLVNSTPRALKMRSDYYHPRFIVLLIYCDNMNGDHASPNFAKKIKTFFLFADFRKNLRLGS